MTTRLQNILIEIQSEQITTFELSDILFIDNIEIQNQMILALQNNQSIKILNGQGVFLGQKNSQLVAKIIEKNTSIETLDLSYGMINYENLMVLINSLMFNNTLKQLHLTHRCFIDPFPIEQVSDLWKGLENNLALRELDLSFMELPDLVAIALAESLSKNKTLLVLNLSGNYNVLRHLSVASAVTDMLKINTTLQTLHLYQCNNFIVAFGPTIGAIKFAEVLLNYITCLVDTAQKDLNLRYTYLKRIESVLQSLVEMNSRKYMGLVSMVPFLLDHPDNQLMLQMMDLVNTEDFKKIKLDLENQIQNHTHRTQKRHFVLEAQKEALADTQALLFVRPIPMVPKTCFNQIKVDLSSTQDKLKIAFI